MAPPQNVEVQNAVKVGVSGHTDGRQHSEREREFTVANEKFGIKNATNVLGSMTLPEPTGGAYNRDRTCIRKKSYEMLHGRFVL